MRWKRARRSSNVEDRRGRRVAAGGGLGLVGIAIVMVIGLLLGKDPIEMLGLVSDMSGAAPVGEARGPAPDPDDPAIAFVESILGETEDVWTELIGQRYPTPRLVVFSDRVQSACGGASSAMGPFYCPADQQIYIDLSFFAEMRRSLGGGGDFAEAYVIAHEVGHHVQTVTGMSTPVTVARRAGRNVEGSGGLLVRQELQADCLAGVWAHHAQKRHEWLEPGDIEEALSTATAIGDDTLQRRSRGEVVPDAFTHGSAEQRVRWFRRGFEHGATARCDTFGAAAL
ncbi:MAG: neutral zinc metallopeptidase [Wenzhouxiangellaceae bacterium]